ncbi:hypothetical protein HDU76_013265, partial [Blyttiomyces sp. JEL0837]
MDSLSWVWSSHQQQQHNALSPLLGIIDTTTASRKPQPSQPTTITGENADIASSSSNKENVENQPSSLPSSSSALSNNEPHSDEHVKEAGNSNAKADLEKSDTKPSSFATLTSPQNNTNIVNVNDLLWSIYPGSLSKTIITRPPRPIRPPVIPKRGASLTDAAAKPSTSNTTTTTILTVSSNTPPSPTSTDPPDTNLHRLIKLIKTRAPKDQIASFLNSDPSFDIDACIPWNPKDESIIIKELFPKSDTILSDLYLRSQQISTTSVLQLTPLSIACATGETNLVHYLLTEKHADPRAQDNLALYLATAASHQNVITTLLDAGGLLEPGILNPLTLAARMHENTDILETLLSSSSPDAALWVPALEAAAAVGNLEACRCIMGAVTSTSSNKNEGGNRASISTTTKNTTATTNSSTTISKPSSESLRPPHIMALNADLKSAGISVHSALYAAVISGHWAVVNLLLEEWYDVARENGELDEDGVRAWKESRSAMPGSWVREREIRRLAKVGDVKISDGQGDGGGVGDGDNVARAAVASDIVNDLMVNSNVQMRPILPTNNGHATFDLFQRRFSGSSSVVNEGDLAPLAVSMSEASEDVSLVSRVESLVSVDFMGVGGAGISSRVMGSPVVGGYSGSGGDLHSAEVDRMRRLGVI